MTAFITRQQFAEWAISLTSQTDYENLTHTALSIFCEFSGITEAIAYELYGLEKKRTGDTVSPQEHLVRRFPLNFNKDEQSANDQILESCHFEQDVSTIITDSDTTLHQIALSIKTEIGPNRVFVLTGRINPDALEVLQDLQNLFRNQILLHDKKERDVLTKLPNRQSFDNRFLKVCEYYRDHKLTGAPGERSSWLAMLDIDHFKQINDRFGHLYGDEVLVVFSQLMEKQFRYNDFLFRFGGEEFVVILNLTNHDGALNAFQRFRKAVMEHRFSAGDLVTVSIGFTHIDSLVMPTSLLDRADKALYHAKANGRNQVVLYEDVFDWDKSANNAEENDVELF